MYSVVGLSYKFQFALVTVLLLAWKPKDKPTGSKALFDLIHLKEVGRYLVTNQRACFCINNYNHI